jgi:hypothetical protein
MQQQLATAPPLLARSVALLATVFQDTFRKQTLGLPFTAKPLEDNVADAEIVIPGPVVVQMEKAMGGLSLDAGALDVEAMAELVMFECERESKLDLNSVLDDMKLINAHKQQMRDWISAAKKQQAHAEDLLHAAYNARTHQAPGTDGYIDATKMDFAAYEASQTLTVDGPFSDSKSEDLPEGQFSIGLGDPLAGTTSDPSGPPPTPPPDAPTPPTGGSLAGVTRRGSLQSHGAVDRLFGNASVPLAPRPLDADGIQHEYDVSPTQAADLYAYFQNLPADRQALFGGKIDTFLQAQEPLGPALQDGVGGDQQAGQIDLFLARRKMEDANPDAISGDTGATHVYGITDSQARGLFDFYMLSPGADPSKFVDWLHRTAKLGYDGDNSQAIQDFCRAAANAQSSVVTLAQAATMSDYDYGSAAADVQASRSAITGMVGPPNATALDAQIADYEKAAAEYARVQTFNNPDPQGPSLQQLRDAMNTKLSALTASLGPSGIPDPIERARASQYVEKRLALDVHDCSELASDKWDAKKQANSYLRQHACDVAHGGGRTFAQGAWWNAQGQLAAGLNSVMQASTSSEQQQQTIAGRLLDPGTGTRMRSTAGEGGDGTTGDAGSEASGAAPLTYTDLNANISAWDDKKDSLDDLSQETSTRLQMYLDSYQKLTSTLSNVIKKLGDNAAGIIANMK